MTGIQTTRGQSKLAWVHDCSQQGWAHGKTPLLGAPGRPCRSSPPLAPACGSLYLFTESNTPLHRCRLVHGASRLRPGSFFVLVRDLRVKGTISAAFSRACVPRSPPGCPRLRVQRGANSVSTLQTASRILAFPGMRLPPTPGVPSNDNGTRRPANQDRGRVPRPRGTRAAGRAAATHTACRVPGPRSWTT